MMFSVVPQREVRDPRQLLYHFPSMPVVRYAQLIGDFYKDQMLRIAEEMAHKLGFVLVPAVVLHWRKKQEIAEERQVKVGNQFYYMMKPDELSKRAIEKLEEYLEEMQEKVS